MFNHFVAKAEILIFAIRNRFHLGLSEIIWTYHLLAVFLPQLFQ
jgi:hypothetical protein